MTIHRAAWTFVLFVVIACLVGALPPAPVGALRAADDKKPPKKDEPKLPQLPGVHIDRKNRVVDLEGKVILRKAEWLELLACMPNSREHESIVTLSARPSHIHAALLLIGLKPGKPFDIQRVKGKWVYKDAKGPQIAVTVVYKKNGKQVEVGANEWIIEAATSKKMPDNVWLFTGSLIDKVNGRNFYRADLEGNLLSLVNFGDEIMARRTRKRGGQGGGGGDTWTTNTKAIPPVGTKVILRLRPVRKKGESPAPAPKD